MDRWEGKIALVTGASAGIGAAIAVELAKHGLKVIGLARRVEKVEELKKNLGNVKGEIIPLKGDVSKEEEINKIFQWIKNEFGTIHVLVNNAGIYRTCGLLDGRPEDFRETIDTNVMGLTLCTQQAYKLMKESGVDDGHIIHMNSDTVFKKTNVFAHVLNVYPASKYAVTALTETLRQELNYHHSKIKVTSISPGTVNTESGEDPIEASDIKDEDALDSKMEELLTQMPALDPKDIADAVIYTLSTPPHVQVHEITIKPVGEPF